MVKYIAFLALATLSLAMSDTQYKLSTQYGRLFTADLNTSKLRFLRNMDVDILSVR